MSRQQERARHPLFMALIASVILNTLLDRDLTREVKDIATVENQTRYHGFNYSNILLSKSLEVIIRRYLKEQGATLYYCQGLSVSTRS